MVVHFEFMSNWLSLIIENVDTQSVSVACWEGHVQCLTVVGPRSMTTNPTHTKEDPTMIGGSWTQTNSNNNNNHNNNNNNKTTQTK